MRFIVLAVAALVAAAFAARGLRAVSERSGGEWSALLLERE